MVTVFEENVFGLVRSNKYITKTLYHYDERDSPNLNIEYHPKPPEKAIFGQYSVMQYLDDTAISNIDQTKYRLVRPQGFSGAVTAVSPIIITHIVPYSCTPLLIPFIRCACIKLIPLICKGENTGPRRIWTTISRRTINPFCSGSLSRAVAAVSPIIITHIVPFSCAPLLIPCIRCACIKRIPLICKGENTGPGRIWTTISRRTINPFCSGSLSRRFGWHRRRWLSSRRGWSTCSW